MKKITNKIIILFLLSLVLAGCDNYDRVEVVPTIFVDHKSLELFVGDEFQLGVNPKNGSAYTWNSMTESVATVSNDGLVKAVGEGTTDIYVRRGDIYTIVPVTVIFKIPLTGIELSTNELIMSPNQTIQILVTDIPSEANDIHRTDFSWWTDDEDVAIPASNGKITAIGDGITKVHYRKGPFTKSITVDVARTRPFLGPHIISKAQPLELEVRKFDIGGEGNAYHDTDTNNQGGSTFRKDNGDNNSPGVDIEGSGNIGYTSPGEWLQYTVDVKDAGVYAFHLHAAGPNEGKYHVKVNNVNQTGTVSFPPTGGWGAYQWLHENNSVELNLSEGMNKIRFYIEAGFNFKYFRFIYLRAN